MIWTDYPGRRGYTLTGQLYVDLIVVSPFLRGFMNDPSLIYICSPLSRLCLSAATCFASP